MAALANSKILFTTSDEGRLTHALGKSYRDLMLLRTQALDKFPDIVLFPKNEQEITTIFQWCLEYKLAAIPFGGGTSVVGGLDSLKTPGQAGIVSIDMCSMDKVLSVDMASMTVKAQGGIFGTVGKIIGATESHLGISSVFDSDLAGGSDSICGEPGAYGGIEDMVLSRIVTPLARNFAVRGSSPISAKFDRQ